MWFPPRVRGGNPTREMLLPALPAGPVVTGMTFDGSGAASLGRNEIDQLVGYALMDHSSRRWPRRRLKQAEAGGPAPNC